MTCKSFIEILSVQTYSWPKVGWLRLATSTSRRFKSKEWCEPKQVRLTIAVQKFGRTSRMITKVTFGVSDVSFMKWSRTNHPSEPKVCKNWAWKLLRVFIPPFQTVIQRILLMYLESAYRSTPIIGSHVNRSYPWCAFKTIILKLWNQ